jgi:hypothetical protein
VFLEIAKINELQSCRWQSCISVTDMVCFGSNCLQLGFFFINTYFSVHRRIQATFFPLSVCLSLFLSPENN